MPFDIFDGCSGKIMAAVLRLGKTPLAGESIILLKRLVAGIRERWPKTRIVFRADSHPTKPEVLKWLHAEDVDFATGLAKNEVLETLFFDESNAARRDWQRKQVPAGTKWERASFEEIRLRVLKVAGRLEVLRTRVKRHLSESLEGLLGGVWRAAAECGNPWKVARKVVAVPPALENRGGVERIRAPTAQKRRGSLPKCSSPSPIRQSSKKMAHRSLIESSHE